VVEEVPGNRIVTGPSILALDPGHRLGYAVDDLQAPNSCKTGVCVIPSHYPDIGKELRFAEVWLTHTIEQYGVEVLIWEAAIPFGGKRGSTVRTNSAAIQFAASLAGVFDLVGTRLGLKCWQANLGTVRLHFTGNGKADSAGKGRVYQRALALGYDPESLDASDAVAIWDFCKHRYRADGLVAGPLFADPLRSMRRPAPEMED
jgi:hypothetical protein